MSHLSLIFLCVPAGPPFLRPLHCLLSEWTLGRMSRSPATWNLKQCHSRNSGWTHQPDRQPSSGKQGEACWLYRYWSQNWVRTGSGSPVTLTNCCCVAIMEINLFIFHSWNSDEKVLKLLFGKLELPDVELEGRVCNVVTSFISTLSVNNPDESSRGDSHEC